jgi:hypothetical protein
MGKGAGMSDKTVLVEITGCTLVGYTKGMRKSVSLPTPIGLCADDLVRLQVPELPEEVTAYQFVLQIQRQNNETVMMWSQVYQREEGQA